MEDILKSNYVVDLTDEIERLFESKPDGRKKSDLIEWKNRINLLINRVNQLSKIKMYAEQ